MIRVGIVRGDFASPWELQNFEKLPSNYDLTVFTGLYTTTPITESKRFKVEKLFSPVDLNLGKINRYRMSVLNRLFIDAHVLYGLEKKLSGFDIAHTAETYYSYTRQSLQAKSKGFVKKVVSTVWENIPFNNEGISGRRKFKKYAFDNIDLFLAVTAKSKEALITEGCPSNKISVLNPGIDLDKFQPKAFGKKFCQNIIRILFVGRLEKDKGIDFLLNLFEKMIKAHPLLELVIVGTGSEKSTITNIQKRVPQVTYLGAVPYQDMPNIYSTCQILVHPAIGTDTWQEQYGMVLVEAMASGLPILSIDKGSIAEVVGSGGIVVKIDCFEKELLSLINNERQRRTLSDNAVRIAKEKYDASKYAQRLNLLYKEILKSKH